MLSVVFLRQAGEQRGNEAEPKHLTAAFHVYSEILFTWAFIIHRHKC